MAEETQKSLDDLLRIEEEVGALHGIFKGIFFRRHNYSDHDVFHLTSGRFHELAADFDAGKSITLADIAESGATYAVHKKFRLGSGLQIVLPIDETGNVVLALDPLLVNKKYCDCGPNEPVIIPARENQFVKDDNYVLYRRGIAFSEDALKNGVLQQFFHQKSGFDKNPPDISPKSDLFIGKYSKSFSRLIKLLCRREKLGVFSPRSIPAAGFYSSNYNSDDETDDFGNKFKPFLTYAETVVPTPSPESASYKVIIGYNAGFNNPNMNFLQEISINGGIGKIPENVDYMQITYTIVLPQVGAGRQEMSSQTSITVKRWAHYTPPEASAVITGYDVEDGFSSSQEIFKLEFDAEGKPKELFYHPSARRLFGNSYSALERAAKSGIKHLTPIDIAAMHLCGNMGSPRQRLDYVNSVLNIVAAASKVDGQTSQDFLYNKPLVFT